MSSLTYDRSRVPPDRRALPPEPRLSIPLDVASPASPPLVDRVSLPFDCTRRVFFSSSKPRSPIDTFFSITFLDILGVHRIRQPALGWPRPTRPIDPF